MLLLKSRVGVLKYQVVSPFSPSFPPSCDLRLTSNRPLFQLQINNFSQNKKSLFLSQNKYYHRSILLSSTNVFFKKELYKSNLSNWNQDLSKLHFVFKSSKQNLQVRTVATESETFIDNPKAKYAIWVVIIVALAVIMYAKYNRDNDDPVYLFWNNFELKTTKLPDHFLEKSFQEFVETNKEHGENLKKSRELTKLDLISHLTGLSFGAYMGYSGWFNIHKLASKPIAGIFSAIIYGTLCNYFIPSFFVYWYGYSNFFNAQIAFTQFLKEKVAEIKKIQPKESLKD